MNYVPACRGTSDLFFSPKRHVYRYRHVEEFFEEKQKILKKVCVNGKIFVTLQPQK